MDAVGSLCLSTVVVADSQAAVVGSALRASVGYQNCTTVFAHCLFVVQDYNVVVDSLLRDQSRNCNCFVVSLLCRFVDPTLWLELGTVTDSHWIYQRRSGRTVAHSDCHFLVVAAAVFHGLCTRYQMMQGRETVSDSSADLLQNLWRTNSWVEGWMISPVLPEGTESFPQFCPSVCARKNQKLSAQNQVAALKF